MADGADHSGGHGEDACSLFGSFINQRISIERLLNWLRHSQTACTDTNCFDDINGLPGTEFGGQLTDDADFGEINPIDSNIFAIVLCLLFGILTLYAMNLNQNREPTSAKAKANTANNSNGRRDDDHDHHGQLRRPDDDGSAL